MKTITREPITYRDIRSGIIMLALIATIAVSMIVSINNAFASVTMSLDLGSTGASVTELQTYLAKDPAIYPQGLITGFYGPLTAAAVQKFQVQQSIVTSGTPETTGYGRVGPTTMARINALLGSITTVDGPWDHVALLSIPVVSPSNTTATFTFSTNEPTRGEVYWSTSLLTADEATGPGQLPYVSGTLALDAGGMQTSHTVTVSNLQANTVYYYLVRVIDSGNNVTMILPTTFRTAN